MSKPSSEITDTSPSSPRIYDPVFFCAYFANIFMLMAISLMFRYSDFIQSIGGNEWHLGWIVGLGTVGAIVFRVVQGSAIDRFGPMLIWIVSLIGLLISILLHVGIEDVNSWQVFAVRLLMNLCIAGVFGSWLSFVSLRVPEEKVAEVIGTVGSSGFVGMAAGPAIGDWIFSSGDQVANVTAMFHVSACLIAGSLVAASLGGWLESRRRIATGEPGHGQMRPNQSNDQLPRAGIWQLVQKFHPGFILVVAAVMGLSISLPGNFLRPFSAEQGIENIKVFFLVYNIAAFVSRVSFRRAPEILGLRNTILLGLALMGLSMLLYGFVHSTATLALPAIAGGLAHSFLFPSVVAGGTAFFPKANRGLATSLVLAMYDVGVLVGSPLVGISLISARRLELPEYPLTFCLVGLVTGVVAAVLWKMYMRGDGSGVLRRV